MPPRLMTRYAPPDAPLRVLHRDEEVMVVVKPSGLLSVPGKPEAHRDCLLDRVVALAPEALLIHRLDLETSGVMVFACNRRAQRLLNGQFERRIVEKAYIARVAGRMEAARGEIDLPLIADWPNRPLQKVCRETGKPAHTAWETLAEETEATRLRLHPRTGRSHQLRVHLSAIGHPILGDPFYADDSIWQRADRLQLHAESLRFRHPSDGAWTGFSDPAPF
ncbi:MAG: pseudouridine synthase [Pseudomonadota bacterium]